MRCFSSKTRNKFINIRTFAELNENNRQNDLQGNIQPIDKFERKRTDKNKSSKTNLFINVSSYNDIPLTPENSGINDDDTRAFKAEVMIPPRTKVTPLSDVETALSPHAKMKIVPNSEVTLPPTVCGLCPLDVPGSGLDPCKVSMLVTI